MFSFRDLDQNAEQSVFLFLCWWKHFPLGLSLYLAVFWCGSLISALRLSSFLHVLLSVSRPESDMKRSTFHHLLWSVAANDLPSCPREQIQTMFWCCLVCCGKTTSLINLTCQESCMSPHSGQAELFLQPRISTWASAAWDEGAKKCFLN